MAVTTPWAPTVRLLANGEAVEAGVTNRPTGDVTQRTQHLKEVIDGLAAGQVLIARDVPLEAATIVGNPVYLHVDGTFHRALAAVGQMQAGGLAAASAYARGVVISKTSSVLGDLALVGRMTLPSLADWNAVFDGGTAAAGLVYLSAAVPGHLAGGASSLAVPIGYLDAAGSLLINIQAPYIGQHTHYEFQLSGNPAGTVVDPAVGVDQNVDTPNPALPGWLPANSTYFPGFTIGSEIPTGAKFGYNLQHASAAALVSVFPPVPASAAALLQAGVELSSDVVVVNSFGIWWMVQTYGAAPWPTDYAANGSALPVELAFVRYDAASQFPAVTELSGDPTSIVPIEVLDQATGLPSSAGQLKLKISTLLVDGPTTDESPYAYKAFVGATLTRGPVTNRIFQGAGAIVSGTEGDDVNGWFGNVTVSLSSSEALQGEGIVAALGGGTAALLNDFPITQLAQSLDTTPSWSFKISESAPLLNTLNLQVLLTSSISGSTPSGFDWRYKVVNPNNVGVALPSPWSAPLSLSGNAVLANTIRTLTLGSVAGVARGTVILVQIRRTGTTDGFAGNLGVQRLIYTLS